MRVIQYGDDNFQLVLTDDDLGEETLKSASKGWRPYCDDQRLRGAWALLFHKAPGTQEWQFDLIESGTKVFFGELPLATYAEYSPRSHAITVNSLLRNDYSSVIATLLAHEMYHARKRSFYPNTRQAAGEWFAEEIDAYELTAEVWEHLRNGKEQSAAAKWLDTVLALAKERRVPELVMLSRAYQEQIFGMEIVSLPQVPEPRPIEALPETHTPSIRGNRLVGVDFNNLPVVLTEASRLRHTLLVGKSGTGKSNLMLQWMLHDANNPETGFVLFDPFGNLAEDLLCQLPRDRVADVVLLDLSDRENPFGLNLFDTRGIGVAPFGWLFRGLCESPMNLHDIRMCSRRGLVAAIGQTWHAHTLIV
jgi:predicted DNA-binding protein